MSIQDDQIDNLLEIIAENKNIDPQGKKRISRVLKNVEVDVLPLIFWKPRNASVPGNKYNMKEQFYGKEKMLYAHLEEIAEAASGTYDALLCLRPNFGTIFIPAILGLDYEVPEDTYPWLTSHLSKEEINQLELPDLDNSEMMQRAIEYIEYFKEKLPEWIHIYQPDTQGPFDIAHQLYGDNLFIDIYDDPDFVHSLLEFTTELYIKVTERLKEVIGEERDSCYHGHALPRGIYMDNGGTRVSEDSATLIAPEHIDEFVIPYDRNALAAFGGGFIHYCGKHEYLFEAYLKLDEVKAINFGNPEMYNFETIMEKVLEYDKCYFGLWPREDDEGLKDYIYRMKEATDGAKRGLLLHFDESMFPGDTPPNILEKWRNIVK